MYALVRAGGTDISSQSATQSAHGGSGRQALLGGRPRRAYVRLRLASRRIRRTRGEALELPINQPFRLVETLSCGQGHRWLPRNDGWHEGVVDTELITIRQIASGIEFFGASDPVAMKAWLHRHFRLDDDVEAIYRELAQGESVLAGLLERHSGIRVMSVDPWECLVYFILSANNNIPRIQRDMERIAPRLWGTNRRFEIHLPRSRGSGAGIRPRRAGGVEPGAGQGDEDRLGGRGDPIWKAGPGIVGAGAIAPVGHRQAEDPFTAWVTRWPIAWRCSRWNSLTHFLWTFTFHVHWLAITGTSPDPRRAFANGANVDSDGTPVMPTPFCSWKISPVPGYRLSNQHQKIRYTWGLRLTTDHEAQCGSNPRGWAYTYRIANFSVGSSDIRSPVWWVCLDCRRTLFEMWSGGP